MSQLQTNLTNLQEILDKVNALPDAGGVELPILTNEGIADDLVTGKELINGEGNIVTGTNPYAKIATDTEVNTQADLITRIKNTVNSLPEVGSSGTQTSTAAVTVTIDGPIPFGSETLYYISSNGLESVILSNYELDSFSINCVVPSIISVSQCSFLAFGEITKLYHTSDGSSAYMVTGTGTLYCT